MYASQRENKLRMKERTNEQKKHIKLEKYQQQQPKKERIIQPDSGRGSVTERETQRKRKTQRNIYKTRLKFQMCVW